MRESEVRFRELFENAPLGYQSLDEEGRLIDVNQAWLDLLGYTRDQVIGKWFGGFLAPQEEEAFRKRFLRFLTAGEVHVDLEMIRNDGSRIIVHIDGKVGHNEQGRFKQTHCMLLDITQRRQAEKKMLDYQKQLQSLTNRLSEVEETERKKMAQSLHDLVGQNLTALQLNLDILLGLVKKDRNPSLAARLEDSQKLLEETTQCIREVISDLRPSVLDDFGLPAALHWYGDRFQESTGILTRVEGKDFSLRLPPLLETVVYRIAQEALTNVLKHASASRVSIRLRQFKNKLQMTITDNGQGFRFDEIPSESAPKGWGLTMMRERALGLGGDLKISSKPGQGTRVVLQVPTKNLQARIKKSKP
ncbi:MAG: PAS domain-containing sensor histidine kinase [Deltaproteobacteria bacterium]|nr:PAS domain-containing sensor histidine kinase [Deltaproteobacteria bacterium]